MKSIILITALIVYGNIAVAQQINWYNITGEQKHIIHADAGLAYGITVGAGYGYKLKMKLPVLLNAEFSLPAGENLLDDFTMKTGTQVRIVEWKSFCFSADAKGIFRRYQIPYVRLLNFGSEFSGTLGYYRHSWFAAAQVDFDKAIVTHFKNSELLVESYPGIKNGWYEPATGGNFYYGLAAGCSFNNFDLYVRAGKVLEQDFNSSPLIPFYGQLGINLKLKNQPD